GQGGAWGVPVLRAGAVRGPRQVRAVPAGGAPLRPAPAHRGAGGRGRGPVRYLPPKAPAGAHARARLASVTLAGVDHEERGETMTDFDAALERLLTDDGFKAALAADPARALAGYRLTPDEAELLST